MSGDYAERARQLARHLYYPYCEDDGPRAIEIDDDAKVIPAQNGGSWVAAWVWLSNETLDATTGSEEP